MSNEINPVDKSENDKQAVLHRAETAALAELASPEAVKAFALIRSRLRPGEPHAFDALLASMEHPTGRGFEEILREHGGTN